MAQAKPKKDVRKNCIDVEKVVMECLSEPERDEFQIIPELVKLKKVNKKLLKFISLNNAKYHQELISINQVKQKLVYGNYTVYLNY